MDGSKDLNPYQVKTKGVSEEPKWKQATIEGNASDLDEVNTASQSLSAVHNSIRAPLSDFSNLESLITNEAPRGTVLRQEPNYSAVGKPDAKPIEQALPSFVERLKLTENGLKKGFNNATKTWSAIESKLDSKKLNPVGKEIGYGVVIRPEWVGSDESKYPVVDGVPVNVNKPITDRQAVGLLENAMGEKLDQLKGEYKEIEKLGANSQIFWLDFAYNAGVSAIKGSSSKPHKMYQYLKAGQPAAAALETFNYWNANGIPLRGLHDRRIKAWNQMASAEGLPLVTDYEWGSGGSTVYFSDNFDESDGVPHMTGKNVRRYLSSKITTPTKRYKGD